MDDCFSGYKISQEDVTVGVAEGMKTFGALKMLFNVRSVSEVVKRSCLKEW